jgi:RNA polymerase sigma-70 factor (ECF subfamily)
VLVARARRGDEDAFRVLYERHRDGVTRVARRWLLDDGAVEDAIQETFFKAWRALEQFTDGDDAGSWLRRIAKNHCHDIWRGSRRRPFHLSADGVLDDVSEDMAPDCVDAMAVRTMLAELAPRDAALLVERHVEEQTVSALARRWGLTRAATDVALHRARVRARRVASAQGLRGLLPGDLLRRIWAFYQRFAGSCCDAITAVGEVSAPMLIVAGLTLPVVATASADATPRPAIVAAAADRHGFDTDWLAAIRRDAGHDDAAPVRNATSTDRPTHAVTPRPAAATAPSSKDSFKPVAIPGTGRQVRQSPSYRKPDQVVGIRIEPIEEDTSTEVSGEPELKAVDDTACIAGQLGSPAGTYCETPGGTD